MLDAHAAFAEAVSMNIDLGFLKSESLGSAAVVVRVEAAVVDERGPFIG